MERRIFVPVAAFTVTRGVAVLQREINTDATTPEQLRTELAYDLCSPAAVGSFVVQFGGGGHYFDDRREALSYLIDRWGERRILSQMDAATERAKAMLPAVLKGADIWCALESLPNFSNL